MNKISKYFLTIPILGIFILIGVTNISAKQQYVLQVDNCNDDYTLDRLEPRELETIYDSRDVPIYSLDEMKDIIADGVNYEFEFSINLEDWVRPI